MIASKSIRQRGPFMLLIAAVMLSSATMIFFLWRYSLKALMVTGALLCFFYLLVRLARAIEPDSADSLAP